MPTAQPCFNHCSLVFQKKCFPVAGADDGESYTEGHFERVALVHAEGAKSNSLYERAKCQGVPEGSCSQPGQQGGKIPSHQHSTAAVNVLNICCVSVNAEQSEVVRNWKTKRWHGCLMCWVVLPLHRLTDSYLQWYQGESIRQREKVIFPEKLC